MTDQLDKNHRPVAPPRRTPAQPVDGPQSTAAGLAPADKVKPTASRQPAEQTDFYAGRTDVDFACERGHEFTLTFADDADLPTQWDCPRCGQMATRGDGTPATIIPVKPPLTHWDRLLQRRSLSDLEQLLADRLQELRGTRP